MRKHYIDYLRVIAIIAVVTIHVTGHYYTRMGKIDQTGWWLSNILNSASRFSVPMFVMISGSVLLGRTSSIGDFYKKRSARLIPPLVFWTFFYVCFRFYTETNQSGLTQFTKTALFVIADGHAAIHLWYLSMFLCLMIFAPFINNFINGDKLTSNDLSVLLAAMSLFSLLGWMSSMAKEVLSIKMEWFRAFPWYMAYFVAGFYFDKYSEQIKINELIAGLIIAVLTLSGAAFNYYYAAHLGIIRDSFVLSNTGPLVFAITMFIFLLFRKKSSSLGEWTIITKLSEASFGMYLIHPVFIYALRKGLPGYDSRPLTYIPVAIMLTVAASFLTIMILRKNRFMRKVC